MRAPRAGAPASARRRRPRGCRLHFGHVGSEFLEGAPDVAREGGLDGGFQVLVALAHDLLHHGRLHARRLELREGFAGVDGVELFRIADENDPGQAQDLRDAEQFTHLARGGEGALVHDEGGLRVGGAHLFLAPSREAAIGDPCVSREEALERLALDPRFRFEGPRGGGRGRQAPDLVAAFFEKRAGALEHLRLASARVALHADHTVRVREDELDGLALAVGQRAVSERLVHGVAAHGGVAPSAACLHQGDRLALLGYGLLRREHLLHSRQVRRVQDACFFEPGHLALSARHRHRARPPGERAREQGRAVEDRLAFREMRHGPLHGLPGGFGFSGWSAGYGARSLSPAP